MPLKHKTHPTVLVSLRTMLTTPYIILVILSITAVGYISFLNGQTAVNKVAHQLRNETALGIKEHLATFLRVPHQINQLNAYAIQSGELDLGNTDLMQQHFLNQVIIHTSITSVYFGSSEGGLVGSGREGLEGSLYVTGTKNLQNGDFQKFGVDELGGTISSTPLATVPNFDARTRPWYVGSSQKKSEVWSDIYILFTGQDIAIAASRPIYDEGNNLLGVVSVDIFLSQLSKYLETLSISSTGQVFIVERSGEMVATSTSEILFKDIDNDGIKERLHAHDSQSATIRQSDSLLIQKYGDYQNIPAEEEQLEFTMDGENQFLQFKSVRDPYGIDWIVVVVIPESAFMEQIEKGNDLTIWLILATLITTIGTSIFVTSKITNRISQLDNSTQALASGEWNRELDTSTHIAELNGLAISFNQMKDQLRRTLDAITTEVDERKHAEERTNQIANELQVTLDTVTVGISHIKNRKVEWANTAHDEILGYATGETRGLETRNFYPDHESFQQLGDEAYPVISTGKTFSIETKMRKRDGGLFWCNLTGRAVNLEHPEEGAIWMLQDITQRQELEQELKAQRDFATHIINAMGQGLTVTNTEGRFKFVNPAYASLFGYETADLIGKSPQDVTAPEDHERLAEQRMLRKNGKTTSYESRLCRADGSIAQVLVTGVPYERNGKYEGVIAVITDLTGQKYIEEELRRARDEMVILHSELEKSYELEQRLGRIDALTSINNRRSLFEFAERELNVALRYQQSLSMILFDIDHFKQINDTYGHLMGDQVLMRIAKAASTELRSVDVIGRYGGDEFIILLPRTSSQEAIPLAERIHKSVSAIRIDFEGTPIPITVSIGITQVYLHTNHKSASDGQIDTVENIILRADKALYTAKQIGNNRTMIFDPE